LAQFKGTIYTTALLFTQQRFGEQAVQDVLHGLDGEDRRLLEGVSPVGWYPTEPVMAYHRKLDEAYGRGDLDLCVELGTFSADWALNTVLKFFLRFRTPNWIMERSSSLWRRYHDSGRWEMLQHPDYPLYARLHDFEVRDPAFCARFRGWLAGAIALTGGKDAHVEEAACVSKGDAYCQYQARWA
jgi:hypothetical protein